MGLVSFVSRFSIVFSTIFCISFASSDRRVKAASSALGIVRLRSDQHRLSGVIVCAAAVQPESIVFVGRRAVIKTLNVTKALGRSVTGSTDHRHQHFDQASAWKVLLHQRTRRRGARFSDARYQGRRCCTGEHNEAAASSRRANQSRPFDWFMLTGGRH